MTNAASASNSSNFSNNNPRIPVDVAGFQYNFCKNPNCTQFGLPASQNKNHGNNTYNLTGSNKAGGINLPLLRCNACGEHLPMKSNEGIVQEIDRIGSYLVGEAVYCTNDTPDPTTGEICSNHINKVPVGTKKAYRVHGKTNSGAKRYICKCGKTVSVAKPNQWQRETHNNTDIFKLLMNKMPLSRIINVLGISWEVLYNRIDFIHKQCLSFAAHRENKLQEKFIRRLYVSVDRQEYAVNWTERKDKRNVILTAVASSCNKTSYVFGVHPNFDGKVDKLSVEADANTINDAANTPPFRKYARLWLDADYEASVKKTKYKSVAGSLEQAIENTYSIMAQREDVEAFDEKNKNQKLPSFGVQTHAEYTMIAHFHFLKKLLGNVEKWRFFLDQDSGIRAACISAFVDEVKSKTMEAFYVRIEKGLTVDEKRKLKAEAQKIFDAFQAANPKDSVEDIKIKMLSDEIAKMQQKGNYKDRWVKHPLPNMSEANKAMCWLTEHNDFDLKHKAWLFNKASMHSVDNFFQKIRRRIAMLERPIHSASSAGRTWNGYSAYNPQMIVKLLDIFRVVHNYIDITKEKQMVNGKEVNVKMTPAMRLGLAEAPIDYQDVIYFEG